MVKTHEGESNMINIHQVDLSLECMSLAMYAETQTISTQAKEDLAHLILNRHRDGRFGKDICEVVYQSDKNGFYQFEGIKYILDGSHHYPDRKTLLSLKKIAWRVYFNHSVDHTRGSLYFFDDRITKKVKCKVKRDNLCFY